LTVAATDNSVITRVNFFVDQNLVATRTKLPYSISMDTSALTNGSHRLIASALDSSGNVGWSPEQTMVVANPGRTSYDPVLKTIVCGGAAAECDSGISLAGRGPIGPEPNAPNTINNSCADGEGGTYGADESLNRLRVFTVDGGKLTAGKPVTIEATVHAFSMTDDSLDLFAAPNARSPVWTRIGTWKPPALGDVTMTASYVLPAGTLQAIRGVFRYQGASGTCSKGVYDDADDLAFSVESAATSTTTAILLSGGFEPTVKGWGKTGAAYFSTGGVEHSGSGYGYLAKANAVSGTIFQDVTIPAGTSPVLSFWLNVTSDEPSATIASDKLKVELLNTSGAVLATLATYSNLDKTAAGVYGAKGGFALGAYAGETVRLQFRASTNAANVTAFRIDDVAIATPGPERITSGGFEPTVSGWAKSGAGYFSKGGVEHTGIGYAYLAKGNSLRGTLSQQMVIPAGTAPVLSFWLNVTSEESAASPGADRLFVEVLNPSGAVLATLDTFSSVDKHDAGSYVLVSGYSLAAFAGQMVNLQLRVVSDATLISAYLIDDVYVR
jgi:hypothetical protein